MLKLILTNLLLIVCANALTGCNQHETKQAKIGIIVPIEHKALDEIIVGFTDTLQQIYHQPVSIKVANAQGDANMQRSIIQQMRDQHYTIIVPIGTDTTQMTVAMLKTQPIISLAADFSEQNRNQQHPCHIAVVHDEIAPEKSIAFIHAVYPKLTHLTLIHSTADKVLPQVDATIAAGKKYGINVSHTMVISLPDLYTAAQAIPLQTQGIFILKDNLIASGISTVEKIAVNRHIPLITSDQGSVQDGAGFSVGVPERKIGIEGAKLAAYILQGNSACQFPIVEMKNLTVFINQQALHQESQTETTINEAAKKFGYSIELITNSIGK